MEIHKQLPVYSFLTLKDWNNWLHTNHNTYPRGIWVKVAKKASPIQSVTYNDVREGALCYGWIDSVLHTYDKNFYLLKLTPRRPKSVWSKINVALCKEYIATGKMQPSGLRQVQAAQSDGRWDAAY